MGFRRPSAEESPRSTQIGRPDPPVLTGSVRNQVIGRLISDGSGWDFRENHSVPRKSFRIAECKGQIAKQDRVFLCDLLSARCNTNVMPGNRIRPDWRGRMVDDGMGDPGEWVDRHGNGLYRYALLRLGDPDRAADVVQETFLHALRSRRAFAGRSSEWTWLVGILKHKVIDQLRASSRRRAMIDDLAADARARSEFDHRGRWRVGPSAWRVAPGSGAENKEFWDVLGSCLGKLPSRLADTFLLRELDGQAQFRGSSASARDHAGEPLGAAPPGSISAPAMPRSRWFRVAGVPSPPFPRQSKGSLRRWAEYLESGDCSTPRASP